MTEQERAFHAEAEEKQRRILAEQSQGNAVVASAGEHAVVAHAVAGGIVLRAGNPAAVKTLGAANDPAPTGTVGPDELPCASTCADAIDDVSTEFLYSLPFSQEQEQVLQDVIAMYDVSREKALARLWQRVVMRQITEEARCLIEQAKADA